jgi:hypothetical protein
MFLPILVSTGLLLVSFVSYAMATALIVQLVVWLIRRGYTEPRFWKNVAVMMIISLVTAAAHGIQIALWAAALLAIGEIPSFEKAFYVSAQNYTALGYGDIVLSERWRLLGPLEAINGLLLLGLSTGLMFAVMGRLIASRVQFMTTAESGPFGTRHAMNAATAQPSPGDGDVVS